jgi:hypothetical protein
LTLVVLIFSQSAVADGCLTEATKIERNFVSEKIYLKHLQDESFGFYSCQDGHALLRATIIVKGFSSVIDENLVKVGRFSTSFADEFIGVGPLKKGLCGEGDCSISFWEEGDPERYRWGIAVNLSDGGIAFEGYAQMEFADSWN